MRHPVAARGTLLRRHFLPPAAQAAAAAAVAVAVAHNLITATCQGVLGLISISV